MAAYMIHDSSSYLFGRMPAKRKTNGGGGGENEDSSCHEHQEFLFMIIVHMLISCLLSITQMMLNGFDDYRSCVEE